MASQQDNTQQESQESATEFTSVRFCPICGTQMVVETKYEIECWVCPECDFWDPV